MYKNPMNNTKPRNLATKDGNSPAGKVPLYWRICTQWRIRQAFVILIWVFASIYIWVSSQTSCDPKHNLDPVESAGRNSDRLYTQFQRAPEQTDSFLLSHAKTEVLFVDVARAWLPQNQQVDPKSVDPKSVDPKSVDPKSVDPKSVDPKSVDPKSVDPKSVDPKSVDPKSVDPKSVDPKSVDPISVDPKRSETVARLSELVAEVEAENQNVTFASAVRRKWVGFPEIAGHDCRTALLTKTNNSLFPQTVERVSQIQYLADSTDCKRFRDKYGFSRYPRATLEEKSFPIAFIILFYKDLDQVLFLLRAIYRPHNVYCLSVDTKSSVEFLEAVRAVSRCLPNVFVASKLENIVYAGFSRLMADIHCMEDLLLHPVQWRYVINMPGQQFPLKTNLELVRILKQFNGANDIEGLVGDMLVSDRYIYKHVYVTDKETGELRVKKVYTLNDPPPHGLEIIKGSTYGTFSRAFVEFALHDKIAVDFLNWSRTIKSPDEYFWGTLHHSKTINVPGGFKGHPHKKPWLTSFSLWSTNPSIKCATIYVHKICIFSPEDFPIFVSRAQLFANKFYITHHPAALHCLDELVFNLTLSGTTRDLSFYRNLPFAIKNNTKRKP